jgi:hypothetical protein
MKYLNKHGDIAAELLPASTYIKNWGLIQYIKGIICNEWYAAKAQINRDFKQPSSKG